MPALLFADLVGARRLGEPGCRLQVRRKEESAEVEAERKKTETLTTMNVVYRFK